MPLVKVKTKIKVDGALKIGNTIYEVILGEASHNLRLQLSNAGCRNLEVYKIVGHYSSLCSATYHLRRGGILSDKKAVNMLSYIMIAFQAHINKLAE